MSPPDPRRRACDELAELLSTPEGLRTARLLQLSEALERPPAVALERPPAVAPERPAQDPDDGPRPISIWQPRRASEEGDAVVFVRPPVLPLGDHYARRRVLDPAKPPGLKRVVYFGESAAAGYLHAPHLTPAAYLESRLLATAGEGSFEVVDLARTNETLEPLVATLASSFQLAPDLLVIFTGNNWRLLETPGLSPYVPSVRYRQRTALALRRGGLAGPVELAERDLARSVARAFERVARLARKHRVPVVIVVPEVNLADWEDRQPVARLPEDGVARWHRGVAEAREHLDAGRFEQALAAADELLALDGGHCPTSHRLRARALLALGRPSDARAACEAESSRGHHATMAFLGPPRISPVERELLRREARRHGFELVDLPRIFREHTGGALPGHQLFLDYCHLSSVGIAVAMDAVAGAVLKASGDATPLAPASGPVASPRGEALAQLGAAIHGAHRLLSTGDKRAHLDHWCHAALATDPTVAGTLRDLLEARTAPCPEVLTPAQQRQLAGDHPLLLQHGWRWDGLDPLVVLALCDALEDAGHPVRDEIEARLVRYHGVGRRGLELARPPYLWEPLERFYPEAMARRGMSGRATLRSPWPRSRFCLVASGESDVVLEACLRLPATEDPPAGDVQVEVRVNGRPVAAWPAGPTWSRATAPVPRAVLRRAINRLTLEWPLPPPITGPALGPAIRRLENGVEADLHPVFGEVFSLVGRSQ